VKKGLMKVKIGKQTYEAKDNCFYFVTRGEDHYQYAIKNTELYYCIFYFSKVKKEGLFEHTLNFKKGKGERERIEFLLKNPSCMFKGSEKTVKSLETMIRSFSLRKKHFEGELTDKFRDFFNNFSRDVFAFMNGRFVKRDLRRMDPRSKRVMRMTENYINENLTGRISFEEAARINNLSRRHFQRRISQAATPKNT
jgi:hypothetical protein